PATLTGNVEDSADSREAVRGTGPGAGAEGSVLKAGGLAGGPRARDHVGGRPPRPARRTGRVRRQVQALADGGPADRAGALPARDQGRALAQANAGGDGPARPRRRRPRRQRVRRGARGRADLRLPVREGESEQAGQAAVAELDDSHRDEGGAVVPATVRGAGPARAGGQVALGG